MYEEKTIKVPVKECNQGTTQRCEDYEVPKQEVVSLQYIIIDKLCSALSSSISISSELFLSSLWSDYE